MKRKKLSSKSTFIYLGFVDIVSEQLEAEEHDFREKVNDLRKKVLNMLSQRSEVTNLENFFEEPQTKMPWSTNFDPITFKISLPLTLQKISLDWVEPGYVKTEEFKIIYDGQILMISVDCEIKKFESVSFRYRGPHISGIPDVRDKFIEMLECIIEKENIKLVPPTITHEPIVFTREVIKKSKSDYVYLFVEPKTPIKEVIRKFYAEYSFQIGSFYNACRISKEIQKTVIDLEEKEEVLNKDLKIFLKSHWWNFIKKRRSSKNVEKTTLEILGELSKYERNKYNLEKDVNHLKVLTKNDKFLSRFFDCIRLNEIVELEHLNYESILKLVEFAKKVAETYSLTNTTIFAALIGAIIGSVITSIFLLVL